MSPADADALSRTAHERPDLPALTEGASPGRPEAVWSYRELNQRVDAVASILPKLGVQAGHRVVLRLDPSPEAVVLLLAVLRAGAVLVPMSRSLPVREVDLALRAIGEVELTVERSDQVREWMREGAGPEGSSTSWTHREDRSTTAALILTSGSSGSPKAVRITTEMLAASARSSAERLALSHDDCWLTSLSLGHIGGLALVTRAIELGCSLVTRHRFDPAEATRLIQQGVVTHASLVPVMLRRLIDSSGGPGPPGSLRCLLVGGAALSPQLLQQALAVGYPIALTYGLTEATSQVATATPDEVRAKPGTVGRPVPGVEIRISGKDAKGRGEILVRGQTVARDRPDPSQADPGGSTGEADPSRNGPYVDREGWLHTGDIGHLDADGDLWITGRKSDRIVTGGVTVEPAEIETVLSDHPEVEEVAVVRRADEEWGERVVALVVPKSGSAPPSLADLLAFSRSRLAPAKRPREVRLVKTLPRTASGKLDRGGLRSL